MRKSHKETGLLQSRESSVEPTHGKASERSQGVDTLALRDGGADDEEILSGRSAQAGIQAVEALGGKLREKTQDRQAATKHLREAEGRAEPR